MAKKDKKKRKETPSKASKTKPKEIESKATKANEGKAEPETVREAPSKSQEKPLKEEKSTKEKTVESLQKETTPQPSPNSRKVFLLLLAAMLILPIALIVFSPGWFSKVLPGDPSNVLKEEKKDPAGADDKKIDVATDPKKTEAQKEAPVPTEERKESVGRKILFFFTGIATILGLTYLLSSNRKAIKMRPILWGLSLQFIFGVLVLYWPTGRDALQTVANGVDKFLSFANEGSKFLFANLADKERSGSLGLGFQFAFIVLPSIIFFSSFMSILYHYGIMQRIVAAMAWIMSKTMGTSGSESLSCAANVFVGQTEAPLIVRPYISGMTMSEINAVMVGGFGTIAGGVMAGIIAMGVNPAHVITASLMAAPASLMIAKILFPETEESATAKEIKMSLDIKTTNGIEAAAKGAADGLQLALNVGGMLIAFIALVKLADAGLGCLDHWVDQKMLGGALDPRTNEYLGYVPGSLKTLFSTLLFPIAWLMGVPLKDCGNFSYLIGMKISLNEFFAYSELVSMKGVLSQKAEAMATFALCGFANFASVAIQIGGITPMVPVDQQDSLRAKLSRLGIKAMIGGAIVSCLTATIAGLLM